MEISNLSNSSPSGWDSSVLLFSDRSYYYYQKEKDIVSAGVLLTGLVIGLIGLIGVLVSFCCKHSDPRNLSVLIVSLVFTSLLQSLSTPVVAMRLLRSFCRVKYCSKLFGVWFASRHCGTFLHLLVALEYILLQRRPQTPVTLRTVYWSLPVVLTLDLICILFFNITDAVVGLGVVGFVIVLVMCIATFKSPGFADSEAPRVFVVAMVAFFAFYVPSFVMECVILSETPVNGQIYDILLCLTNARLISDALLCRLVSRFPPPQNPQSGVALDNQGFAP